jgi:Uncharacterized protein conserved in bacteria (DUF2252)
MKRRRQTPRPLWVTPDGASGELLAADDDPLALLEKQSVGRVPELLPVRYGRMLISPFTFCRCTVLLMAADLAKGPRSELTVQLCGDAHLSNFGLFASPERRLVFDVKDSDETNPGPFEWDVKRLATNLEIAGRDNGHTGEQRLVPSRRPRAHTGSRSASSPPRAT